MFFHTVKQISELWFADTYTVNSQDFPHSEAEQTDSTPGVQRAPTQSSQGQRRAALRDRRRRRNALRRKRQRQEPSERNKTFKAAEAFTSENSLSLEQSLIVFHLNKKAHHQEKVRYI